MTQQQIKRRSIGLWGIVAVMALLAVGTVSNVMRINAANTQLQRQAQNGQRALVRSCRLAGVSRKIYVDELDRGKITAEDFALFASTLVQACSSPRP